MRGFVAILILIHSATLPDLRIPPRWGAEGHRVIARLAADRLTPAARTEITRLLGKSSMADVSTWADQIRGDRPETDRWHYVNIPVIDSVYRRNAACPRRCVITVLDSLIPVLRDRKRSDASRSEALRYIIHLVADLHQPLHAGDRGDRGGNDLQIKFLGGLTNLHALWDSRLLSAVSPDEDALVATLQLRLSKRTDLDSISRGSVTDWAMESHNVARGKIYRALPQNLQLTRQDANALLPVLEEVLLRGGVRLAATLNQALTP